jgi:hypothetical protein
MTVLPFFIDYFLSARSSGKWVPAEFSFDNLTMTEGVDGIMSMFIAQSEVANKLNLLILGNLLNALCATPSELGQEFRSQRSLPFNTCDNFL